MTGTSILAIAVVALVVVLLFARRDRARRIGFGSEAPAAARRERPRRRAPPRVAPKEPARPAKAQRPRPPDAKRPERRESTPWESSPPSAASDLSPNDLVDVISALASGQKVAAMKLVRDRTNMGLREAKRFVERLQDDGRA